MDDSKTSVSIILPAFNVGPSIGSVLDEILDLAEAACWEVIVVDDGSGDNTRQEVEKRSDSHLIRLLSHPYNRGYGAAIKTGIRASRSPLVATMDADGQHAPEDLLSLMSQAEQYDLVIGQRTGLIHSRYWRMPGKWILGWFANYLTRRNIPDLNSGMRVFKNEVIQKYLHLCPDGFSLSTTTTLIFFNRGYAVHFHPISIRKGNKLVKSTVRVHTGFDTLLLVVRLASLFHPLRVFLPASFLFILTGMLWGFPYLWLQRGVSVGALLLILTGLLLFFFGLLTDQVAQLRLEKYE